MPRHIRAFDPVAVHAGNRGLAIDHDAAAAATDALLARMTLAQKIHEIRGLQAAPIDGLYHAGGDAALGIPAWRMVDGPRGARTGTATAFPVAIARGATFDVELERRVGLAIGAEVAARGGNVLLAPTINLLRHPGWGRAQETYSEDPFHMGAMAVAFISGAQNHVLTSPKHFALNNLENTRFEMSADIDARSLHEVYLPHFRRCVVEAAAGSVMSAYNRINGVYCGEHRELLTDILRTRWGFRGFVESDWFLGTRSTAEALNAGLDIEMPGPYRFSDERIAAALAAGELDEATITRAARNSVYQKVAWNVAALPVPPAEVVECDAHLDLARAVARQAMVLLKNARQTLPLTENPGPRIALVGPLADAINIGDRGSSYVTSTEVITPLTGLRARQTQIVAYPEPPPADVLRNFDVAIVVAGFTHLDEGEFIPLEQSAAEAGGFSRGGDRAVLALPAPQQALIEATAGHAARTVVVLQGGSAIEVTDWIDRVDAVLMTWYAGAQGGHALADVLFGDHEPGGRLPVAFPARGTELLPWDISALAVDHGLLHGYRWLDHHGIHAQFPFGFGLGYTTFVLDAVAVVRGGGGFRIDATVRNRGARAGACVVQAYVGAPDSAVPRAPRELKGFGRVALDPGEAAILAIDIGDELLAWFDPALDDFALEPCCYRFAVGFSSADLPFTQDWRLDATGRWQPAG